ncbi:hypothetical protein M0805_005731 [Coniferiporia weirii]|nr:hypothetical protein M0805_005731 [Coniferiporia weirii]
MSNLKTVITLLKSDKSKDRQQGITSLREVFSRSSVVENLDENKDGRAWLVVFQALFTAVLNERAAVTKKGSAAAAAERRLRDAASVVRWLTEKSVTQWSGKVTKALVKHLLQTMMHAGSLFAPVALDYVKTLRVICAYTAHLDHIMMERTQWVGILSFSFAVLLDGDLKSDLEDESDDMSEAEVSSSPSADESTSLRKRKKRNAPGNVTPRNAPPRTVSPEQIEFAALISIILRSPRMRFVSPDHPRVSGAILRKLSGFFKLYPVETSAHFDIVGAVQATLDSVSLNARDQVIEFGVMMWDHLLQLWSTKSRPMKEGILIVLKALFPYVTHAEARIDRTDGMGKLLRHLQTDHETRWGFEELSIDTLRLEILRDEAEGPFVAQTFRAGFNFSAGQTTAWVVLELLADTMKELYLLSESNHSSAPDPNRLETKRVKLGNPIKTLLDLVQDPKSMRGKAYSLQSFLFFIDRHWSVLHSEMQPEVVNVLLQLIGTDDTIIQTWVFCCFAAIACADYSSHSSASTLIHWDGIWSHTMRRTNAPVISRVACHAAHALLLCKRLPITRILAEIETMTQDINVQGPSAPYDSVCAFLTQCIKIANQDTRLYRMHLDDKVLSWLIENWNILNGVSTNLAPLRLDQHTIRDVLSLLESTCGLSEPSSLMCPIQLPQHAIVDLVENEMNTAIIREFQLKACLSHSHESDAEISQSVYAQPAHQVVDLARPDAKVRKASLYLLKTLEAVTPAWENNAGDLIRPLASSVRRTLDLAILTVCFESSLVMSGISSNRRTLLAACKLITLIAPHLLDFSWSSEELAILLSSFSPLTSDFLDGGLISKREAFIAPGKATGVKGVDMECRVGGSRRKARRALMRRLQGIIWQSSDVQDAIAAVLDSLKQILNTLVKDQGQPSNKHSSHLMDDERDGFGPIRTTNSPAADLGRTLDDRNVAKRVIVTCVDIIAQIPVTQPSGGKVTRDRSLIDIVCDCDDDDRFLVVLEPVLRNVQQQHIPLTVSALDRLLMRIERPLMSYKHGRSNVLHIAAIHLLDATSYIWLQQSLSSSEPVKKIRTLIQWSATSLSENILCWHARDALCRFLDRYLNLDPLQAFLTDWAGEEAMDPEELPDAMLPLLTKDEDVRVRLTAALSCARLFSTAYIRTKDPMEVYTNIREQLCVDLSSYEHMLTRFLCLANILISSSAVRRGPYWHLLETCLHTQSYVKHIESVLSIAAEKMGLRHFSELFEAYASQIAYSIRISKQDFFRFPPHLLGYKDRKECAEATFVAFSPANLLAGSRDTDEQAHGQGVFSRHCLMIDKKPVDGLLKCFADIVGYQVVFWMYDQQEENPEVTDADAGGTSADSSGLLPILQSTFSSLGSAEFVQSLIKENVDGIVCAILRTIGDPDYHRDGPVMEALTRLDKSERSIRAFRALMKFRGQEEFEMHSPNLPAFSTSIVLLALSWLSEQVETVNSSATTYHVMQHFFANINRCPLINEQLRLLTCLCVWISLSYNHFRHPTLLRVLMSGATTLLAEPDLSAIAQGMLDWAFIHLRETQADSPHIVEILIRISTVSQDFIRSPNDVVKDSGNRMKEWIEAQLAMFGEIETLRKRMAVALAAWPGELSDHLSDMRGELNGDDLSAILDDPYLAFHKFKIARRLAALVPGPDFQEERFAKHDFWRLKDCIPTSNLLNEEVDAFTTLLIANSGHVRSQAIDQFYGRSIGSRYLRLLMQKDDKGKRNSNASIKRPVVNALLDMLTDQSAKVIHVAYRTLRLLAGIEPLDSIDYGSWPSEHRGDITFLNFCPIKEDGVPSRNLTDLQQKYVELASDFTVWISEVTAFLSCVLAKRDPFYAHLSDVLRDNTEFAEQMYSVLVHTLLLHDLKQTGAQTKNESKIVLSDYLSKVLTSANLDVQCHRSVVNLVLHLRNFDPGNSQNVLAYNQWLDLDFMLLSRSAIKCGAYTTALLFLELATEFKQTHSDEDKSSERILFDIYNHIDEPDGFYGIKAHDLQDFLLRRFHHERQWEKAFQFHGAGLEAGDKERRGAIGMLESLHSFGFNNLAMSTLQSMGDNLASSRSSDMEYRLGWRTGTWDLPDPASCESSDCTIYVALRAIHRERDASVIDTVVSKALTDELRRLRSLGNENLAEVRQVTRSLMCLAQIRRWRTDSIEDKLVENMTSANTGQWNDFSSIQGNFDFPDLENVIATRISLLRSARQREQRDQIGTMQSDLTLSLIQLEKSSLVRLSEAAREANQLQIALNSVVCALQMEDQPAFDVRKEFANVLWLQKERKFAVECLKEEMKKRGRTSDVVQDALTLAKLGEWTSEACLEKPDFIHSNFFAPAIKLLLGDGEKNDGGSSKDVRADVFHKCALFAEQQYHAIVQSPDIIRLKVYSERKKQELREREETLRKTSSTSTKWQELTQHQRRAKALYEQDTAQFIEVTGARDKYLNQAIQMLSLCLEASDSHDVDATIRMCSLWFANFAIDSLSSAIPTAVSKVPSRKFVFLAHQLSARLSASESQKTTNQTVLQSLLLRMCSEHPFHSLYQVYSLQSSTIGTGSSSRRRSNANELETYSQIDRATAATDIFDRLQDSHECADKARDVRLLCDAYLEWAKYSIKKDPVFTERKRKKEPIQIPKTLGIRKISNLRVPVTTADTPLDPSMRYNDCVWIQCYAPHFETAGGINLPKISYCIGSDGAKYKQLFKGEGDDDLRQDAVMEQVFELCNQVLCRDRETRKRQLSIRSYKVVPLAAQAGLLEFVGNTIPMQGWLALSHARYHPTDLAFRECANQLSTLRKEADRVNDKTAQKTALVNLFNNIRQNFRPVMRHFFTERHKVPQSWFEMRLRYSRSVAVTSIVGHVLGLGDRHISNILLDTVSGEVVHIDLGIAFEQGKLLPIPERVPFRLTADIVDGFGMSGTEGVFRRCSEETLRVLRDGSDVINTVLEVFRYDPLHSWTASAVKIRKAQADSGGIHAHESERLGIGIDMSSGMEDEAADRALNGVARKLDKSLSVEYTVNELIAEATDVTNLALMFAGWSPFC